MICSLLVLVFLYFKFLTFINMDVTEYTELCGQSSVTKVHSRSVNFSFLCVCVCFAKDCAKKKICT